MNRAKVLSLIVVMILLSVQSSAEILRADKIEVKSGETFSIEITGEDFKDIVGVDITIQYDPEVLS
ncbi:MAG: hypothetical protein H5T47_04475, partial [Archaeoglobi archaeon]|nr:hypothetical protein [Candidatus Mnemosynella bozhongmuii]